MDGSRRTVCFLGDLEDPWVTAIVDALGADWECQRIHCPGDFPCTPWESGSEPDILLLHRTRLTAGDAARLARWKEADREGTSPRTVLCMTPYVRHAELERWTTLVDLVVNEATAEYTLSGQLLRLLGVAQRDRSEPERASLSPPSVEIVTTDHELGQVIADLCVEVGYRVAAARDLRLDRPGDGTWTAGPRAHPDLTIWDIPVLEPGWESSLGLRSSQGRLLALIGFADRDTVSQARGHGASACLDLPCDFDDLRRLLGNLASAIERGRAGARSGRPEHGHALPPPPARRAVQNGVGHELNRNSRKQNPNLE